MRHSRPRCEPVRVGSLVPVFTTPAHDVGPISRSWGAVWHETPLQTRCYSVILERNVSNHCSIACLDLTHAQAPTPRCHHPGPHCDWQSQLCCTLSHNITLFDRFLCCELVWRAPKPRGTTLVHTRSHCVTRGITPVSWNPVASTVLGEPATLNGSFPSKLCKY